MQKKTYKFSVSSVDYYFDHSIAQLKKIVDPRNAIIVTDENVYGYHQKRLKGWNTVVLKAGEEHKVQSTVDALIENLIEAGADRQTTLVGMGGGVITDLTGYAASVYMRGVPFGFVPTSLLGMVDASIGGKNGIDVGVYKNMVGVIRQPRFLLYDHAFLNTLPQAEWENGFAEIIKHACIKDAAMFRELSSSSFKTYQGKNKAVALLVQRNVMIKTKVVQQDEFEKGDRKLLNFGHTLGHALENQYELSHGQAISIGMTYACHISEKFTGFKQTDAVVKLLAQYNLPTYASFDRAAAMDVLKMDKKRVRDEMNYIMLEKIGKAVIKPIPVRKLEKIILDL
jgi:3-dehydroquinate synthase